MIPKQDSDIAASPSNELKTEKFYELDWLKRWAMYSPQNIALIDGDTGRSISYSELFFFAQKCASLLKNQFHIAAGDRIAVVSTNELEYIILFFAAQRLGAVLVPLNFRLTSSEISHIISDCQAKLIVAHEQFYSICSEVAQEFDLKLVKLLGENSLFQDVTLSASKKNMAGIDSIESTTFPQDPENLAMILYTSGTTGAPKGALISHRMLYWNSINTTLRLNISQKDSAVIFLPLFHTGGWNVLTTPLLHRGAKVILTKKFDAEQVLKLTSEHQCALLFGVPTTMDMMARSPNFKDSQLKSLRYAIVGGEPMAVELIHTWQEKGIPVRQGFGLTEFGPNVFSLNEEDSIRKIGSIGFPNFYIETKIVDTKGNEVGPDEIGELLLKGPMMMSGYWRNEKATLETIKGDWLYTGDLVRKDSEGFYYVVGRKKEMYISGGENVYPAEVEKVIRSIPGVQEVAVIGVKDEKWGEVGKAFIVLEKSFASLDEKYFYQSCEKKLAKFKIPKYFIFTEELPKGDSGKILKKNLK